MWDSRGAGKDHKDESRGSEGTVVVAIQEEEEVEEEVVEKEEEEERMERKKSHIIFQTCSFHSNILEYMHIHVKHKQ